MILVGNQRGGARDMAVHLLKDENDHVLVYSLDGFASDNLHDAFKEVQAIAKGTRCKQYLYSLSVNPPPNKEVKTEDFIKAIDEAGRRLGLDNQPRAIVFHEKEGRRHAHVVFSRIDAETMTAIHLPHTKRKLVALTRDLYIEHGWKMPDGLMDKRLRNPRNFSLAEWQQAKRIGKDPRAIKGALQDAWAVSDTRSAFSEALKERGFALARGDRRGFVAVDYNGEVFSLTRSLGVKSKSLKARLGDFRDLPDIESASYALQQDVGAMFEHLQSSIEDRKREAAKRFEARRKALLKKQSAERERLKALHVSRMDAQNRVRASRFRKGLGAVWDWLRGEHMRIQRENEQEAYAQASHDRNERDALIFKQLRERQRIEVFKLRHKKAARRMSQAIEHEHQTFISRQPEH